ncbi:MAG: peptide deformylase [Clostridia bacterium]|nr:peptide deformylase [Clostridia bacterium]
MARRQLRFQDDPVLRKRCRPVDEVDDGVRRQLDDMMDTLHATDNGAALAANQVGILRRLVVIDFEGQVLKLVNPRIVSQSGTQDCIEGCLSFPNVFGKTVRPQSVTIEALDENGNPVTYTGEGEMAKCFCHELEHLDGIVFTDHVTEYV